MEQCHRGLCDDVTHLTYNNVQFLAKVTVGMVVDRTLYLEPLHNYALEAVAVKDEIPIPIPPRPPFSTQFVDELGCLFLSLFNARSCTFFVTKTILKFYITQTSDSLKLK